MRAAIIVLGVSKEFRARAERPRTLKEALIRRLPRKKRSDRRVLRNVSFSVEAGRMVGIVGANGSGKSTLLRLISGVVEPSEGRIEVAGRIGALIDLGAGFHPDLTGRENVFVAGVIAGLTRYEVQQQFDSIVEFSELQEFIDSPLRIYSTGMQMRLGFAVAVHTAPKVLLVDEMLSVGDVAFQHKCLQRIRQFKEDGCAIVLVSHDPAVIKDMCDEALWLRTGQLQARGEPETVVEEYLAEILSETRRRTPRSWPVLPTSVGTELRVNENRFGSLEMEIHSVRLVNPEGLPVTEINSGDALRVEINYLARQPIESPNFCVSIKRDHGVICSDTNTQAAGFILPTLLGSGQITVHFDRLDLVGGLYDVNVAAYERNWSYAYDFHQQVYPLLVRSVGEAKGTLLPPHHWVLRQMPSPEIAEWKGCGGTQRQHF